MAPNLVDLTIEDLIYNDDENIPFATSEPEYENLRMLTLLNCHLSTQFHVSMSAMPPELSHITFQTTIPSFPDPLEPLIRRPDTNIYPHLKALALNKVHDLEATSLRKMLALRIHQQLPLCKITFGDHIKEQWNGRDEPLSSIRGLVEVAEGQLDVGSWPQRSELAEASYNFQSHYRT